MAILVFWVVMPCCHTGGYQCSGGILAMKIEALYSSKTLEITCKTVWCLISEDYSWHLHCCEVKLTSLHCEGIKGEYRRYISYLYLTLVLDGVSGQHNTPTALYPWGKNPGTHRMGGWVGHRTGLVNEARRKVLYSCWGSNPSHAVRSQSLYWMNHRCLFFTAVRTSDLSLFLLQLRGHDSQL
jgi:hypothetical protein